MRRHSYLAAARQEAQRVREHTEGLELRVTHLTEELASQRVVGATLASALAAAEEAQRALGADAKCALQLRSTLARVESERDESLRELARQRSDLEALRLSAAAERENLRAAELDREALRAESARHTATSAQLREQVTMLEAEAERLRKALRVSHDERDSAQASVREHATALRELNALWLSSVQERGDARAADASTSGSVGVLESVSEFEDARAELNRKLALAEAQQRSAAHQIAALKEQCSAAEELRASTERKLSAAERKLAAIEVQKEERSRETVTLKQRCDAAEATRDVLAAQLAASQKSERDARREHLKVRTTMERLQRTLVDVRQSYSALLSTTRKTSGADAARAAAAVRIAAGVRATAASARGGSPLREIGSPICGGRGPARSADSPLFSFRSPGQQQLAESVQLSPSSRGSASSVSTPIATATAGMANEESPEVCRDETLRAIDAELGRVRNYLPAGCDSPQEIDSPSPSIQARLDPTVLESASFDHSRIEPAVAELAMADSSLLEPVVAEPAILESVVFERSQGTGQPTCSAWEAVAEGDRVGSRRRHGYYREEGETAQTVRREHGLLKKPHPPLAGRGHAAEAEKRLKRALGLAEADQDVRAQPSPIATARDAEESLSEEEFPDDEYGSTPLAVRRLSRGSVHSASPDVETRYAAARQHR